MPNSSSNSSLIQSLHHRRDIAPHLCGSLIAQRLRLDGLKAVAQKQQVEVSPLDKLLPARQTLEQSSLGNGDDRRARTKPKKLSRFDLC